MKSSNTLLPVHIYVLYDPKENLVRYIGRTCKPVRQRLSEHISKARNHAVYYLGKKPSPRVEWINSILEQGRSPKVKRLTTVMGHKKAHLLERKLIGKYCQIRHLVNSDDRGEDDKNRQISDDEKQRISNSLKKYYETNLNPRVKAVEIYDLVGNYLNSYPSATEFAKAIRSSVRSVTRVAAAEYGRRQMKGYQIKYADDPRVVGVLPPIKKRTGNYKGRERKTVYVQNIWNGEITEYNGLEYALETLGIKRHLYYSRRKKADIVVGPYRFLSALMQAA